MELRNSKVRRDAFQVAVANEQSRYAVDERQLAAAARAVLRQSSFRSAAVSLAVVDDRTIHELNRRYLDHDWPTDVLSFVLAEEGRHLEGEVIISADTAAAAAAEVGWSTAAEQLLYIIHGVLHLIGYRDKDPADALRMRAAENEILDEFGFDLPGANRGVGVPTGTSINQSSAGASLA